METAQIETIVEEANRSDIGRHTGLSLSGVSRILSGGRTPRSGNLYAVASHLGVPMDELFSYLQAKRARKLKRQSKKRVA